MKSRMQIFQILFFFLWFCYEIVSFFLSYQIVKEQSVDYGVRNWYYISFNSIIVLFCLIVVCTIKNSVERNKVFFFIPIFWTYGLMIYLVVNIGALEYIGVAIKIILFLAAPIYAFYWLKRRDLNLVKQNNQQ